MDNIVKVKCDQRYYVTIHHLQVAKLLSKYRGKMIPSELYKEIESAKSKVRIRQIIGGSSRL